jgi:ankyrin repeat protein
MEFDVPQPQEARPLLIEAVLKNDLKFVDALIRAGEDVDATDNLGRTVIEYAQEAVQNANEKVQLDAARKILEVLRLHKWLKDHPGGIE